MFIWRCVCVWLCRPATLHPREGQPALWEFPGDHRCEGWSRHHHRQLWSLPAHSQLRLRLHHQRQRSGRRERRLRRGPRDLGGRRMGPHDHRHQQRHRSARLQYGPGRSDAVTQPAEGYSLYLQNGNNPQVISTHELTGSGEGVPEHWPKIFFYFALVVQSSFDCHGKPQSVTANTWSQQMHLCTACRWQSDLVAFQRRLCPLIRFCTRLLAVSAATVCDVAHSFGAFEKIFSALWIPRKVEGSISRLEDVLVCACLITEGRPASSHQPSAFMFACVAVSVLSSAYIRCVSHYGFVSHYRLLPAFTHLYNIL